MNIPYKLAEQNRCCIDLSEKCISFECMGWRWQPLMADQPFLDAVKLVMERDKLPHPKAARYVGDNRAEFNLPTEPYLGHCGRAGKP